MPAFRRSVVVADDLCRGDNWGWGDDFNPRGDEMVQQIENIMIHVIIDFLYTRTGNGKGQGWQKQKDLPDN